MNWKEKLSLLGFLITIFLLRIPPFYFFPIESNLLLSYGPATFILLILFIYLIFIKRERKILDRKLVILMSLYYLSQSLSILGAVSVTSFLQVYVKITLALIIYVITIQIVSKHNLKYILGTLFFSALINALFALVVLILPRIVFDYLRPLIYSGYWKNFYFQYYRGRYFGDSFDEIVIPLIFLNLYGEKGVIKKFFYIVFIGIIIFIVFASNWRTKTVMLILTMLGSLFILLNKIKTKLVIYSVVFFVFLIFSNIFSLKLLQTNVSDRFLSNDSSNINTITKRIDLWNESIEMWRSSPLTGVGLGNYFEYMSNKSKQGRSQFYFTADAKAPKIIDDPHNIFFSLLATSGILGLITFIGLILYFIYHDAKYLIKSINKNLIYSLLIVMYWSIFAYSLANPYTSFYFLTFSFLIRGLVDGLRTHS